ncbi:MAG: rod shape-determining protein [Candidatus Harrisonbacteria bacterium RIFCSPLOWO2_01_FULL_44_18]|uniref:Cell shape-determining protein MreB n=1 Tax=Candidatus Harrisonbacteria bacterium RIFCSPLOWO2_01_FULL_44_18 TaxID=1798407 RepID=A0A1G1ZMG9_9BACT|nr:MAG: rod shape-determining protein [Candidatus Harrisonbacteria bacterium RIFCSPLOWO2_01_FULL_44_18]
MFLFNYFSKDIGIDLGTTNSLVYLAGRGIVINEPSIAALNNKTSQILAIGTEAKNMLGRTPQHINVIKPLINGVISDFDMTQEMLRYFLKKIGGSGAFLNYRRAVIGVPSNLTEVERKSVEDAIVGAGVSKAYTIEEPLAAALGARLPINEPTANMIIDIGGGTTEIAVISMGGTVTSKSLKVAGDKFNEDIIRFIRDEFSLAIGEPTAEELKSTIGSAVPVDQKLEMTIRGRDLATGLPKEILVKDTHIRAALAKSLKAIVEAVKEVVEVSPPELVGDVLRRGIYLCGGGSLLRGVDQLIAKDLTVNAAVVDDPLTCVARGTGIAVENFDQYKQILDNPLIPRDIRT